MVFSCSNSIKVNETNLTSICSGSGEWSPNPRDTCVYPYAECSNPGIRMIVSIVQLLTMSCTDYVTVISVCTCVSIDKINYIMCAYSFICTYSRN